MKLLKSITIIDLSRGSTNFFNEARGVEFFLNKMFRGIIFQMLQLDTLFIRQSGEDSVFKIFKNYNNILIIQFFSPFKNIMNEKCWSKI